jgi:hypothetical protein
MPAAAAAGPGAGADREASGRVPVAVEHRGVPAGGARLGRADLAVVFLAWSADNPRLHAIGQRTLTAVLAVLPTLPYPAYPVLTQV